MSQIFITNGTASGKQILILLFNGILHDERAFSWISHLTSHAVFP